MTPVLSYYVSGMPGKPGLPISPMLRGVSAIILAGGQSRRMQGRDKGLVKLRGRPLIEHVIERMKPQVDEIVLSANRNLDHYRAYGYPVYPDSQYKDCGPLSGILNCARHTKFDMLIIVGCDQPNLPPDLVSRLTAEIMENTPAAIPFDGNTLQNLNVLMKSDLIDSIETALRQKDFSIHRWLANTPHAEVDFSHQAGHFINLNSDTDVEQYDI